MKNNPMTIFTDSTCYQLEKEVYHFMIIQLQTENCFWKKSFQNILTYLEYYQAVKYLKFKTQGTKVHTSFIPKRSFVSYFVSQHFH